MDNSAKRRPGGRVNLVVALAGALGAVGVLASCSGSQGGGGSAVNANADGGAQSGASSGTGTTNGGGTGGGTADGGTAATGITFGQPGPWPVENRIYGPSEGIQEAPVVATSTDEAQDLWVATNSALYLMKPGDTVFRRYAAADGLHLPTNPQMIREDSCNSTALVAGGAVPPGISTIVGGAPGEVFVGYYGVPAAAGDCTDPAVERHSGKVDRVRLQADGSLEVKRFDLVSTGMGMQYWHNRTVYRMVYDHLIHPHTLYVGTDHGVDMILPDKYRDPAPGEWTGISIQDWMADHLHVQVCFHGDPVCLSGGEGNARMGDWRGLAVAPDGDLWHAGRWSAGKIRWTAGLHDWSFRSGSQAYAEAFGNGGSQPVFFVPAVGDVVSLSAVAVAADKTAWFASSWFYGNGSAVPGPGTGLGLAHDLGNGKFEYFQPPQAGMTEQDVQDMVALPDGRLVLAGASSGLVFWDPATGAHTALRAGQGIPDDHVQQLELDTMVNPPTLHVSTRGGAATIRVFPK